MSEELLSGNVEPFPFACRAFVRHASMSKKLLLYVPRDAMQSRKRHGMKVGVSTMYVCVCVYVCDYMYICMYVCLYVYIYIYV